MDEESEAATFLDESAAKFDLATSNFLLRVSNFYGETTPFLAADCIAKVSAITSRLSTKTTLKPAAQRLEKLRRFLCSKCNSYLNIGNTATLSWKSTAATLRRFGGAKRLAKILKRKEFGLRLSKKNARVYGRYWKYASTTNKAPSLVITCSICGTVTSTSLGANPKTPRDVAACSTPIGTASVSSTGQLKKRRRKKKDPNAGLNISCFETGSFDAPAATNDRKDNSFESIPATSSMRNSFVDNSTPTPSADVPAVSGSRKKKFKSKLEKLLAEEAKMKKRPSFGNSSPLASFLESL